MVYVIPFPASGSNPDAPLLFTPALTYVQDDFDRADTSPPDLGAALSGQVWDVGPGWQITDGDAVCTASGAQIATVDAGYPHYRMSANVAPVAGSNPTGLVFRYIDGNNFAVAERVYSGGWKASIRAVVDGVSTVLFSGSGVGTGSHLWEVAVRGTTATFTTYPGSNVNTFTADIPIELSGATGVGMLGRGGSGFHDFAVYSR